MKNNSSTATLAPINGTTGMNSNAKKMNAFDASDIGQPQNLEKLDEPSDLTKEEESMLKHWENIYYHLANIVALTIKNEQNAQSTHQE